MDFKLHFFLSILGLFFCMTNVSSQISQTTYEYDELNRVKVVLYDDGTTINYVYDQLGNRKQKVITEPQALTYVPDDAFEQKLIDLGYDDVMDDYVVTDNINDIEVINLSDLNISDATGIEDFISLRNLFIETNELSILDLSTNVELLVLHCGFNQLTELDFSNNVNLIEIDCLGNQLTDLNISQNLNLEYLICEDNLLPNLDVSQNLALSYLDCANNSLMNLDVSQNINLESLQCGFNSLTQIDVTQNENLKLLNVMSNNLTFLDISQNPLLTDLGCYLNQLTELDFSNNPLFESLFGSYNHITELDFSENPNLERLRCHNNNLTSLNVKNGNNSLLSDLISDVNPDLFCIQVDDEVAANNGTGVYANWQVDSQVIFSEDCSLGLIENHIKELIQVSPNPTENFINVDYGIGITIKNISIIDISGREIKKLEGNITAIPFERFDSGVYLIKFTDIENNHATFRIIKK
ncbi:T9SS type A sorting domain-containing protein [Bizionia paragorgiae]|uniref:T9SS type A sorting domain-containing protein n=1 Tax=Bizionia paragorgiae TaxID=283786 RepID=UPI003A92714A